MYASADPGIFVRGVKTSEKVLTSKKKNDTKGRGRGRQFYSA